MSSWKKITGRLPKLYRYLLVAGAVVFIGFLFPDNAKFKYEFEKGQSWRYEDLYAPFDFAIKKTEEELQAERSEVERTFSPVYEIDEEVAKRQKQRFEDAFYNQLQEVRQSDLFTDVHNRPNRYVNYAHWYLDKIYSRGVIQLEPSHEGKGKDFVINIVRGNVSQRQTLENVYTPATARDLLSDSLPYSRLSEPEFIFPVLENLIVPNLFFNDTLTQKFKTDLLASISTSRDMVQKGEMIVARDGVVTEDIYQRLISYKEQYEQQVTEKKSSLGIRIGYFLLTVLIVGAFLWYLRIFSHSIFQGIGQLTFVLMWLVVYAYVVFLVEQTDILSAYMIPFCIVPIVIKTFYNERLAFVTHIIVVLIASFLSSLGYEFTFLQILAGIVVLLSDTDTRDWTRFFQSMVFIFFTYALSFLGLSLIKEGTIETVDWQVYSWIFLNVFLTLLAYPLIPLLERLFGFVSSITLVELSDMNRPLLQELAMKAPGTLQHSLQVANLSEAAARRVGADPLLVKVAALYHDIGKTKQPDFFIENQSGKSPHEELSFLESAQVIIEHVTEGVRMAKKYRLPNVLIDFIRTHHGTTRTEYFYRNYVNENPDDEADESLFRYPGPKPRTKEETILMMADSIEAACKSLKNPSEQDINGLIDKIVAGKISHGQFSDSEMTFEELETCKSVFKKLMRSVHHVRIEYPEEKKKGTTAEKTGKESKES